MFMQIRRNSVSVIEEKTKQTEFFDLKVISYLVSTPDEVATALTDEKQRL